MPLARHALGTLTASRSRTPAPALTRPLPLALCLALSLALFPALTPPAHADSTYAVPAGATAVTITGEGNGHGHGMSQYGANAAAHQGVGTDAILRHYYPGTSTGRAGGKIRVLLSTRPTLVVGTRSGLVASVVAGRRWRLTHLPSRAARKARRWAVIPVSPTQSRLSYLSHGQWRTFRLLTGQVELSAGGAPVRLFAGADSGTFRGALRSAPTSAGGTDRDVVNVVPLESYVKGVVPNEMPAQWAPAAVRAQAVAARTYAVHERTTSPRGWFDVFDTTLSQVYRGAASERRASNRAVDATRGRILTYAGRPAFTQFSSSNGGWMLADPQAPYLVSGRDVYDPVRTWSVTVPMSALQARFMSDYPIGSIAVRTYPGAGGWVQWVVVTSRDGKHVNTVPGETVRGWAGLKSASFRFAG
jgi:peptidoglycan hydrolase-like amidase